MTPTEVGRLVVPEEKLLFERLEDSRTSLVIGLKRRLEQARERLGFAWRHPVLRRPEMLLAPLVQRLDLAVEKLHRGLDNVLKTARERLKRALVALESLSPLGVLARGYSVPRDEAGNILPDAAAAAPESVIETILFKGRLKSRVTEIRAEGDSADGEKDEEKDV